MEKLEEDCAQEDLNELESRLYAQIHHEIVVFEDRTGAETEEQRAALDNIVNGPAVVLPLPPEGAPVVTGARVLSSKTEHLHNSRYWNKDSEKKTKYSAVPVTTNEAKPVDKEKQQQATKQPVADKPKPQITPQHLPLPPKTNTTKNQQNNATKSGPFVKQDIKLKKIQRLQAKRKKAREARRKFRQQEREEKRQMRKEEQLKKETNNQNTNKNAKPKENTQTVTQVEVIDLDTDTENDDVIIVPLPAAPIIDIDDSNSGSDHEFNKSAENMSDVLDIHPNITPDLLEENAIDAADVELDKAVVNIPKELEQTQAKPLPVCQSPCSSVLSSDDFIGQIDRKRLLERNVCADDEDLLFLTSEADCTPAQIEKPKNVNIETETETQVPTSTLDAEDPQSEPEFVPPSNLEAIKESYRVDQAQFRALDVYESESDFLEGGVYAKVKPKPTVIRTLGSSGTDQSEDSDCIEVVNTAAQKTKRLRKRRASSNRDSEANNITSDSDVEADVSEGVKPTGIPFISRGVAVEKCKTKVRKSSQSSGSGTRRSSNCAMSDDRFIESLNTLAKGGKASTPSESEASDAEQSVHSVTARDIAEKVLQNMTTQSVSKPRETQRNRVSESSVKKQRKTTQNNNKNDAIPEKACAGLENVFAHIDALQNSSNQPVEKNDASVLVVYKPNKRTIKQVNTDQLSGKQLIGWNDEMRHFYNDSWNGENFRLGDVLRRMKNNRKQWVIQMEDRLLRSNPKHNVKCLNCCEFGHVRSKCTRPKKPLICYMCGEQGHQEPRCPNTICLRCGRKAQYYVRSCNSCTFQNRIICPLCKVRGHGLDLCPDKWRRYHSTTKINAELDSEVKYKRVKNCSLCGARGHLAETCYTGSRFLDYPLTVSTIRSHQKSYKDQPYMSEKSHLLFSETAFFHMPMGNFSIKWTKPLKPFGYYVRFLKSCGLTYLLNTKRKTDTNEITDAVKRMKKHSKDTNLVEQRNENKRGKHKNNKSQSNAIATAFVDLDSSADEIQMSGSDAEYQIIDTISTDEEAAMTEQQAAEVSMETIEATSSTTKQNETENFKAPNNIPISMPTTTEAPNTMDSDSNYSFSEHFEASTTDTSEQNEVEVENSSFNEKSKCKSRPMDGLPDVIPLSSGNDDDESTNYTPMDNLITGISMCFGDPPLRDKNDEDEDDEHRLEIPCECKIYMERKDTEYLFSPDGQLFLKEISKELAVDVRIDFTSCGYVLVAYGIPRNQTKLQTELKKRCRDVQHRLVECQSQKPPKRVDVLIRYLRDGICQLQGHLGNVNEIFKDLKYHERQTTKASIKTAEKKRRLLNMILIGQAGLLNGSKHLLQLVEILNSLVYDFKADDIATSDIRTEIEKHWRMIFTGYAHKNYLELVENYHKLPTKNQLTNMHIDPRLLGQKLLNTTLSEEQKRRMSTTATTTSTATTPKKSNQHATTATVSISPFKPPASKQNNNNSGDNGKKQSNKLNTPRFAKPSKRAPRLSLNIEEQPQNSKRSNVNNQSNKRASLPPFVKPQQRTGLRLTKHRLTPKCEELLKGIESQSSSSDAHNFDAKNPSVFWSREALKYIDACMQLSNDATSMQRLKRVQGKAMRCQLSHNDFCALVRFLSILERKQ